MRNGAIYLVVNDFDKAVAFYEAILEMKVSRLNGKRFAIFNNEGLNLCLMNGHFDSQNEDEIKKIGDYYEQYDDMDTIANSVNTKKMFINLSVDDLEAEYKRIDALGIARDMTPIRFIQYVSPYWYFTFMDLDGNPIEITGGYDKC